MSRSVGRVTAVLYLGVSTAVAYLALGSPFRLEAPGIGDAPYFVLVGLHYIWGLIAFFGSLGNRRFTRARYRRHVIVPEVLGASALLFFLFVFIYALNANMPYVQRFMETGGNVRLALDTHTERLLVWIRVFPLVAVDAVAFVIARIRRPRVATVLNDRFGAPDRVVRPWSLLYVFASVFLCTIAIPSFLDIDGVGAVAWVAYVPLFLVLRNARFGHGVFYGIVYGAFAILLSTYWLGTFALVSLPVAVFFFVIYYAIFTPIALVLYRAIRVGRPLVFPLAFTFLEFARSSGFLGFPWALAGHSQYAALPLVQMTEVTGVWGLSFLVLLGNSAVAELLGSTFDCVSSRGGAGRAPTTTIVRSSIWLGSVAAVIAAVAVTGTLVLVRHVDPDPNDTVVKVAQIQQNNDPRKTEYEATFATLMDLTDEAMKERPDLVVWSETAFVPNIRHWSVSSSSPRYHNLVMRFLDYQKSLHTWLLTGNDDYEDVEHPDGSVRRSSYNAAVLFDANGTRRETYRKMRLVPFTESFPFREQLPWLYDLLISYGVELWEPGTEPTVFHYPTFTFATPICFEDTFPSQARKFVNAGADAILNLSNDFWSLTEVEAKQHLVAGMFRAVENRRPLLRTTASGATVYVDPYGRVVNSAPYYQETYLISDLRIPAQQRLTLYTRLGDWFPLACAGLLVFLLVISILVAQLVTPSETPRPPRQKKTPRKRTGPARAGQKMSWRELWDD